MKTSYITYFSYDNSDYSLWDITDDMKESIQKLKTTHIPFLIEGEQPEISVLTLIEVELPDEDYKMLCDVLEKDSTGESVSDYLRTLEESGNFNTIYFCDGSVGFDLIEYFYQSNTDPEDIDEDDFDECEWSEKLDELEESDSEEYNKLVQEFVDSLIQI